MLFVPTHFLTRKFDTILMEDHDNQGIMANMYHYNYSPSQISNVCIGSFQEAASLSLTSRVVYSQIFLRSPQHQATLGCTEF